MKEEIFWLERLLTASRLLASHPEGHFLRPATLNTIAVAEKHLGLCEPKKVE